MDQNKVENKIKELQTPFGEMRHLTTKEQQTYNEILDELFQDTGISLFDILNNSKEEPNET